MTATTLTEAPDAARAVTDRDYYDRLVYQLDGKALTAFEAAVKALTPAPQPLSDRDILILHIAVRRFPNPGRRDEFIRRQFGISPTRFYLELGRIIDRPEALRAEPAIVGRLRARREDARARRSARQPDARSAA